MRQIEEKELGIYIHIPFCKRKCYYCDFISYCNQEQYIERYIEALTKEIEFEMEEISKRNITTIYIGGGTPSAIETKHISKILEKLKIKDNKTDKRTTNKVDIAKSKSNENIFLDKEITIEVNPGTVTKEKIKEYKNMGINRLSIGLQETHNNILKQIGRIHTFEEFLDTYKIAREVGFENINVDLIIGLPNQRIEEIKENLNRVIELNPEHISVYSLIVEDGTILAKKIERGEEQLPDEELERNMYWYVKNTLELNGYKHYEISNFAKEGYQSNHNMNCWEQMEYVGVGVAAHSYLKSKRFSNTSNLLQYIQNVEQNKICDNIEIQETQLPEDMQKEYMLLGLRKIDGVSISKFKSKFGNNPIFLYKNELNKLVEDGLLKIDLDCIKLTNKGIDFANVVWENFI